MLIDALNVTYDNAIITKTNAMLGIVVDPKTRRSSVATKPSAVTGRSNSIVGSEQVHGPRGYSTPNHGSGIATPIDNLKSTVEFDLSVDESFSKLEQNRALSQHRALSRLFNKTSSQELTESASLLFRPSNILSLFSLV